MRNKLSCKLAISWQYPTWYIHGLEMVCSGEVTFIRIKRRLNLLNLLEISSNPNSLSHAEVKWIGRTDKKWHVANKYHYHKGERYQCWCNQRLQKPYSVSKDCLIILKTTDISTRQTPKKLWKTPNWQSLNIEYFHRTQSWKLKYFIY